MLDRVLCCSAFGALPVEVKPIRQRNIMPHESHFHSMQQRIATQPMQLGRIRTIAVLAVHIVASIDSTNTRLDMFIGGRALGAQPNDRIQLRSVLAFSAEHLVMRPPMDGGGLRPPTPANIPAHNAAHCIGRLSTHNRQRSRE